MGQVWSAAFFHAQRRGQRADLAEEAGCSRVPKVALLENSALLLHRHCIKSDTLQLPSFGYGRSLELDAVGGQSNDNAKSLGLRVPRASNVDATGRGTVLRDSAVLVSQRLVESAIASDQRVSGYLLAVMLGNRLDFSWIRKRALAYRSVRDCTPVVIAGLFPSICNRHTAS